MLLPVSPTFRIGVSWQDLEGCSCNETIFMLDVQVDELNSSSTVLVLWLGSLVLALSAQSAAASMLVAHICWGNNRSPLAGSNLSAFGAGCSIQCHMLSM